MRRLVWLLTGVFVGFGLAHEMNKTDRGRAFFEAVNDRARDFRAAVGEGYRSRDTELRFGSSRAR
ncbi:MAG TPA: hypothetical protein VFQ96_04920 [Microbacteriaceae bacterium]|nr:hypothetical protein [Microbacteriaceae bacterium]